MALDVTLDRDDSLPLYRQIATQIQAQISEGKLPPGTHLPTIRALAGTLGVTRLTVQNAYAELQSTGWVESTVGRGTFVRAGVRPESLLATIGQQTTVDSVLSDMMQADSITGVRSLAGAFPDPGFFPADEFWRGLSRARQDAASLLGYACTLGDEPLRLQVASLLREQGISALPDEILITGGATQALSLAALALARPGDRVLVDQSTFLGFLNILAAQGLQPVAVPLDDQGPRLDDLARLIVEHRPAFYYTIPTFHNPTGLCFSLERRRQLLELAIACDLPLVEDDLTHLLAYDEPPPPALKSLDRHEKVTYISGFSKTLFPGLRVGYLIAPRALAAPLSTLRHAADLCGPPLLQRALARFLADGHFHRHLNKTLPRYRARRDALLDTLQATMPPGTTWTIPAGGFCCWVTLPEGGVYDDLHRAALQAGVAFAPGEVFLPAASTKRNLRLCFGKEASETIRLAVERLAQLVRDRARPVQHRAYIPSTLSPIV
jgi:DNA-binding transcriptional MocR family regulator